MKLRGGEFSTGTTGKFQPELTHATYLRGTVCILIRNRRPHGFNF